MQVSPMVILNKLWELSPISSGNSLQRMNTEEQEESEEQVFAEENTLEGGMFW